MKKLSMIMLSMFLVACSSATFDGTTEKSFESSMAAVAEDLGQQDKADFAAAFIYYSMRDVNFFKPESVDENAKKTRELFNGKTAKEVISQYKMDKENEKTDDLKKEIQSLEEKKLNTSKGLEMAKQFEVRTEFKIEDGYLGKEGINTVSITNNSDYTISSYDIDIKLISPDREVAWGKDSLRYKIPGGLAAGESLDSRFSADYSWERIDFGEHSTLVTTVLTSVRDAEEKEVFEIEEFSIKDQKTLDELKTKIQEKK